MRVLISCVAVLAAGVLSGCNQPPESVFATSEATQELMTNAQRAVEKATIDAFGTPEALVAWKKFPIDYGEKQEASADGAESKQAGWKLKDGRNLYMRHCVHCHGVAGDGNGPTAKYLNPRPRDYRHGVFKFTSTLSSVKASRADLERTLNEGIPGTSMPSFLLLKEEETDAIIEYVRWLSIRGEFERKLTNEFADYKNEAIRKRIQGELDDQKQRREDGETEGTNKSSAEFRTEIIAELDTFIQDDAPELITDIADSLAGEWEAAEDPANVIVPMNKRHESTPESISAGRKLYMSEGLKCYSCHGSGAKGDGVSTVDYWAIPNSNLKYPTRGLHDVWGNPQKPRNLTRGIYRGGRRPIDIYRRIFGGIKGTQMSAFENALREDKDAQGNPLSEEAARAVLDRKIWDIVNYVLDVPFQQETPAPVLPTTATVLQAEK